jgi:outer membrane protein OmpA-like peptidoglycan-associated protein
MKIGLFYYLLIGLFGFSVSLKAQDTPRPMPKPVEMVTPTVKPILSSQSDSGSFTMKNSKYMVSANDRQSNNTILTPPALPQAKTRLVTAEQENSNFLRPIVKPLQIFFKPRPQDEFENRVIARYTNDQVDDRMAGGRGQSIDNQRLPAQPDPPRSQLRETREHSPFKTAQLPRAARNVGNTPIILFFKENSSELEVGQMQVVGSDIEAVLKRTPNKRATIYGYAERGGQNANELSMKRAQLIADHLMSKGIEANRLDVRAMGNDTSISPKNRVDVILL